MCAVGCILNLNFAGKTIQTLCFIFFFFHFFAFLFPFSFSLRSLCLFATVAVYVIIIWNYKNNLKFNFHFISSFSHAPCPFVFVLLFGNNFFMCHRCCCCCCRKVSNEFNTNKSIMERQPTHINCYFFLFFFCIFHSCTCPSSSRIIYMATGCAKVVTNFSVCIWSQV